MTDYRPPTIRSRGRATSVERWALVEQTLVYSLRPMCSFIEWRDLVWSWAYRELDAIQTGVKPLPDLPDFIAAMPAMTWPEKVSAP